MEELRRHIQTFSELSDHSWNVLLPILTRMDLRKGEFLIRAGEVCSSLYFICQGYCRAYTIQDGQEVNTFFYFENDIATNINSYVFGKKSTFAIQACERCTIIKMEKSKIFSVSRIAPEIEFIAKRNLQSIAARQEKQLELYRLLTASSRYKYLEMEQPEMLQRIPLSLLASYLGVKRETLSRIRAKKAVK